MPPIAVPTRPKTSATTVTGLFTILNKSYNTSESGMLQIVETTAIEVERLGESNRFVVKLLADKNDALPP